MLVNMKIYTISFALLLLLLMQGCSKEETPFVASDGLAIDVQVENVLSRAVIAGTAFGSGSQITVVVKNSNSNESGYTANGTRKVFTLSNSTWTIDSDLTLSQAGKIIAYYPDNLSTSVISTDYRTLTPAYQTSGAMGTVSAGNLTLNGNQIFAATGETDYLIGTGTDVSSNAVRSSITLRHAMAMVAVRLIKGTTYSGAAKLTQIAVANKSGGTALCSGTVNVQNYDFTKGRSTVSYTRTLVYNALTSDQSGVYIGFLAYPATLYEEGLATLTLTVDNKKHTLNLPGNEQGDLHWYAGNCILYDITMHGTEFKITGVTVAPWVSGNSEGNMEVH